MTDMLFNEGAKVQNFSKYYPFLAAKVITTWQIFSEEGFV